MTCRGHEWSRPNVTQTMVKIREEECRHCRLLRRTIDGRAWPYRKD